MKAVDTGPTPTTPGARVLYVEDVHDNFVVTEMHLRKRYRLDWASSDRMALDKLRTSPSGYAAILMDIELNGAAMDGIQLTRLLSGQLSDADVPAFARGLPPIRTPILFVTAYGSRYTEAELKQAGGSGVVLKPVNFITLSLALARLAIRQTDHLLGNAPAK